MKQVWNFLVLLAALTTVVVAAAVGQAPPTELEGTYSALDHQIELRWHAPEPAPDSYNVYRKLVGDPSFSLLASAPDRRYDDGAVSNGQTFQYRVTAVYGATESTPTGTVQVTVGGDSAGGNVGSLPPRSLVATADDRGVVELVWLGPDSAQVPNHYRVYRKADVEPSFAMIGTAGEPEFTDSLITPSTPYDYFVTAMYLGDVESVGSDTAHVVTTASHDSSDDGGGGSGGGNSAIAFTSAPALIAPLGQPWSYLPALTTNPAGQTVCFELHEAPSGMTMDAGTGALSWTPAHLGLYEVELRARICSGSDDAEQRFLVMVTSGIPGSLSGHVTDGLGNPVVRVRMKIYDATNGAFAMRTRTDSAGAYVFPAVNPGTYFLRADADSDRFEDVWYVNAKRLADATGIVIAESAAVTADMILTPSVPEDSSGMDDDLTISGTVLDSAGAPLGGVHVMAFHASRHDSSSDDLFNDDHESGHDDQEDDSSALTDSTGAFHLPVSAGTYLLRARKDGYGEQFWNGKSFVLDADALTVSGDTSGIDFRLKPEPTGTGVISGTVLSADDGRPRRVHVVGLQKNFVGEFTGFARTARSDSGGHYALGSLPTGFYVVMAKDDDQGSIPSFYTPTGGTAILDSAALLFVDGTTLSGIDLAVSDDSADGLNEIEGEVESESEHPGKTIARATSAISPLGGAIVVVSAADGSVAGATVTDAAGAYTLPGLAAGEYTVTFQKPGNATVHATAYVAYVNNAPTTTTVSALLTAAPPAVTGLMAVHTNWNLVSVPVNAPDLQAAALFPSAASQAFSFSGSYHASSILETGAGYWVKFPSNEVLTVPGTERLSQTVGLVKGWNLVGSLSYPVAVASLQTTPAGILSSEFFSYGAGYSVATAIEPGRGYWVKATEAGTLSMDVNTGAVTMAAAPASRTAEMSVTVTFTDADGNAQSLALSDETLAAASELPPAPPAGAFDARFASGRMIEAVAAGTARYPIALRSAGARLSARIGTPKAGMQVRLVDERGTTLAVAGSGSVVLPAGTARVTLVAEPSAVPARFALDQNYPNPFNPTTTLRFALPTASRVSVRVYNLLGQEVAALLDGSTLEAGAHDVQFDATRLASGVYLYRMEASSLENGAQTFSEVRKMVLVK